MKKMENKNEKQENVQRIRCQFAELSEKTPQCARVASGKIGDYWFCDEHGSKVNWGK